MPSSFETSSSHEIMRPENPFSEQTSIEVTSQERGLSSLERRSERFRQQLEHWYNQSLLIDEALIAVLSEGESETAAKQTALVLETLRTGPELPQERIKVCGLGVNVTTQRTYLAETLPDLDQESASSFQRYTAFVKGATGELRYAYDPETKRALVVTYNPETGACTEKPLSPESPEAKMGLDQYFAMLYRQREALQSQYAEFYGVAPEEIPPSAEYGIRQSIEAGTSATREYAVSRFDLLLNFNTVPRTVLRREPHEENLYSVQEAVSATNPETGEPTPPQIMTVDLYDQLIEQGPAHPGAASLMRIACLDFLTRAMDRHPKNILFNPGTNRFYGIDNALSCGRSHHEATVPASDGTEFSLAVSRDENRSIPLEIIRHHDSWLLDDEAHASLTELYEQFQSYRELFDEVHKGTISESSLKNHPAKQLLDAVGKLFGMLYGGNQKIISREFFEFFKRLEYVVKYRRPPNFPVVDVAHGVYPSGAAIRTYESHFEKMRRRKNTDAA